MRLALILAAALLAGCATRPEFLGNRLACSVAGDRAWVVSLWGVFGIASSLDDGDAQQVCQ